MERCVLSYYTAKDGATTSTILKVAAVKTHPKE